MSSESEYEYWVTLVSVAWVERACLHVRSWLPNCLQGASDTTLPPEWRTTTPFCPPRTPPCTPRIRTPRKRPSSVTIRIHCNYMVPAVTEGGCPGVSHVTDSQSCDHCRPLPAYSDIVPSNRPSWVACSLRPPICVCFTRLCCKLMLWFFLICSLYTFCVY